jgi:hypothetical protein
MSGCEIYCWQCDAWIDIGRYNEHRESPCPKCGTPTHKPIKCEPRGAWIAGEMVQFCFFLFECKTCREKFWARPEVVERCEELEFRVTSMRATGQLPCRR